MSTLAEIDRKAQELADKRRLLQDRLDDYERGIQAVRKQYMRGIKSAAGSVANVTAELKEMVGDSAGHFRKPRTKILHGIKVGFQKAKGKLKWESAEQVVKLIKKHFSDQADVLIKTTEKPVKGALGELSAAELKKIGVTVNETGDEVIVKSTESEVDKLVDALLKGDEVEEMKEAG